MSKNPFLKLSDRVIRKVYRNAAEISYHVTSRVYSQSTGELGTVDFIFHRIVAIDNPAEIRFSLVDGKNFFSGDLTCTVSRLALEKNLKLTAADDPKSESGEVRKLGDYRSAEVNCGGLDCTSDTLSFGGSVYRIVKVTPRELYAGVPSEYRIQLRSGGGDGELSTD